jgi:1-acyl-sn-glycerol-3-phosphate acyltransferase
MRRFHYYTPIVLQKIGYVLFYVIYRIFVHLEIRGKEHLRGLTGPVILASNHANELDVTAIPQALPFFSPLYPIYFVSNPAEKYRTFGWRSYIYGGKFFHMLGGYEIFSGHRDYAKSLENHIDLLEKGRTLWIAPEGKRTRDGKFNPARGGLGFLAYTTAATVVPIAVDTFFNMSVADFFLCRRTVRVSVGAPMTSDEVVPLDPDGTSPSVEDFRAGSQRVLDRVGEMME